MNLCNALMHITIDEHNSYDFIKDNHYVLSKLHELKELLNGEL